MSDKEKEDMQDVPPEPSEPPEKAGVPLKEGGVPPELPEVEKGAVPPELPEVEHK